MNENAAGRIYDEILALPPRPWGLVLGCSPLLANGLDAPFFVARFRAGLRLLETGKVERLILSGRQGGGRGDEIEGYRRLIVAAGLQDDRLVLDGGSNRTLDSIVRAKWVLGCRQVTIISQSFHNPRALYLAEHVGLDAIAYNSVVTGGKGGDGAGLREALARLRAIHDAISGACARRA